MTGRRGVLLVEAMLSAVIIGTGLVFISRGLSTQLKALRTVEEYDRGIALARAIMMELEAERTSGHILLDRPLQGGFGAPYELYQWMLAIGPKTDEQDTVRQLTLTVQRSDGLAPPVVIRMIWPKTFLLMEWQ